MTGSFGIDVSTFPNGGGGKPDFDPVETLIGDERATLEACAHRLMIPKGSLPDVPDLESIDLTEQVGRRMSTVAKLRIAQDIERVIRAEQRVLSASVVGFDQPESGHVVLTIRIELATGTFTVVASADNTVVQILSTEKT